MFCKLRKNYEIKDCFGFTRTTTDINEYIEYLEEDKERKERQLKEIRKNIANSLPKYKIEFNPNNWESSKDYQVKVLSDNLDRCTTEFYNHIKSYGTRKEAEKGLELIKEEMSKNA